MGKVKEALIQDMMLNPDRYNQYEDYEFWMQCRAEELLEREKKVIYESKVTNVNLTTKRKS